MNSSFELPTVDGDRLTGLGDLPGGIRAESSRGQRVIAAMGVMSAAAAFFLDVDDLAMRGNLAVLTSDAPAGESGEA